MMKLWLMAGVLALAALVACEGDKPAKSGEPAAVSEPEPSAQPAPEPATKAAPEPAKKAAEADKKKDEAHKTDRKKVEAAKAEPDEQPETEEASARPSSGLPDLNALKGEGVKPEAARRIPRDVNK